jgi:predicted outer membrane repeat protein
VTVVNCTFENSSSTTGGAIEFIGVTGSVTNCTFINNKAEQEGGAVRPIMCFFIYCKISINGESVFSLSGIKIYNAKGLQGGGLYFSDTAVVTVDNSYIETSSADTGVSVAEIAEINFQGGNVCWG